MFVNSPLTTICKHTESWYSQGDFLTKGDPLRCLYTVCTRSNPIFFGGCDIGTVDSSFHSVGWV